MRMRTMEEESVDMEKRGLKECRSKCFSGKGWGWPMVVTGVWKPRKKGCGLYDSRWPK